MLARPVAGLEEAGLLVRTVDHRHALGHCDRCNTVVRPWFQTVVCKNEALVRPAIERCAGEKWNLSLAALPKSILTGWKMCGTGAFRGNSGGDTAFRLGIANAAKRWWRWRNPPPAPGAAAENWCRMKTCWTPGSVRPCGPFPPWAGRGYLRFRTYFPTSVLVTGYDIIFFWVARMIFTSLEFTGQVPFKHVYIHGLVRDELGRKMSKSLGNGIDPLDVIAEYGADTLRFALLTGAAPGNDIRFQQDRVEAGRTFANKLWNAARFVLMNLDGDPGPVAAAHADLPGRWILRRFNETVAAVTANLEKYELGEAAREIYEFIWNEYCDWYIEAAKLGLKGDDTQRRATQAILKKVLTGALQLLHPIMPFITEEIWQHLEQGSIAFSQWPRAEEASDGSEFELVMELVRAVRNIRSELNINPGQQIPALLYVNDAAVYAAAPWVSTGQGSELRSDPGEKPREAWAGL